VAKGSHVQGGLIPFAAKTIREKFRAGSRLVVAVGGPPASGKTAFSEALVKSLNDNPEKPIQSCLVSIDGFRLDTSQFESLGILPHWGAKRSFDFDGIRNLLEGIRVSRSPVFYPVYDRTKERAVPGAGVVSPETDIVIVKGNYLLLDDQPWIELETLFDLEFFLDTPMPRIERRLIERWRVREKCPIAASRHALSGDIPNAELILGRIRRSSNLVFLPAE
jgi:fructokinase